MGQNVIYLKAMNWIKKFWIAFLALLPISATASLAVIGGIAVCLGYNKWYFEVDLPNGAENQQILDIMDYISNSLMMPIVAIGTCILIGWIAKPKTVIDEVEKTGHKFGRKTLYIVMIKVIAPIFLAVLLLQSLGVL